MALQTPTPSASYAQSGTYLLSLDAVVDAILLDDANLISVLGIDYSNPVTQTKHEWDEDSLNPVTLTYSNASLNISATAFLLAAATTGRITAGTLLKDQLSGKYETLLVTAVNGTSATVTRGYGASSGETHAANAVYDIIANARPQGMTCPKDESMARTRPYNYTQIFSKGVNLTGTALAIKHNGIASEDTYQVDNRMRELIRELDRSAIMGITSPTNVTSTAYGTMGGLIDLIKHASSGNTNSTAETLTPSVLNTMAKQIFDDGGTPDIIIVGGTQKQKISAFDQAYRRSTMDSRRSGFTVDEFLTDLGVGLRIVVDRWMPNDCCIMIDSSRVKIKPMVGRSFFIEKMAKTGDREQSQIVGEYTMEVKNAAKAHAIHWNLKQ